LLRSPKAESQWAETICDPIQGTVTTVTFHASGHISDLEGSPDNNAEGVGSIRIQKNPHTTAVFRYWHNVVEGRDNLGPETFEGQAAYRFRLTKPREENSIRDVVNSDVLFSQVAQTTWKEYPTSEYDLHLTAIRPVEPFPGLFYLPQEWTITDFAGKSRHSQSGPPNTLSAPH
jgi:hypothetical protein